MLNEEQGMNKIYQKNLESLKEENSDIKEFLLKYNEEKDKEFFTDITEVSGKQVLYVVKEDQQYQLDSMYDSDILLRKWFEQFTNRNFRSRYILFGLGNGMYVNKILQEAGEDAIILVLEPSAAIFQKVIKVFDVSMILKSKQVHLVIEGVSDKIFLDLLREQFEYNDIFGACCRVYLNYGKLFLESNQKFDMDVKFHCNCLEAAHSVAERMGSNYYSNSVLNYLEMVEGKSLIALNMHIPKNIPAFIVSSGPSLDKNILELKKVKNRGFVVAADSAVGALLKNDIIPDLVMTIDAFKLPQHFEHERIHEVPLVCSLSCNWELLACHKGERYFVNDENVYVEAFYEKINKIFPRFYSGGSVATSIFALLESLEFKTIVLVGQDLAFLNDKMYSINTIRGSQKVNHEELNTLWMDGIDGKPVLSSYEFQIYLNWFEEEIKLNKKLCVIDATEGGAIIRGTKIQTLSETIEQECKHEVDITEIMKSIPDRFTAKEKKMYIEYMNDLPNELRRIKCKLLEQMKLITKIQTSIGQGKISSENLKSMFIKAGKIGEEIEQMESFFYLINYCQIYIKQVFQEIQQEDIYNTKGNEIVTMGQQLNAYYSIMNRHIGDIIVHVESIIESYKDVKKQVYVDIYGK